MYIKSKAILDGIPNVGVFNFVHVFILFINEKKERDRFEPYVVFGLSF